jgi:hypothetical protein
MEIPGSAYLYALATVSITFVGFSALLLLASGIAYLLALGVVFREPTRGS